MQHSNAIVLAEKLYHLTAILEDAAEGYLVAARYSENTDLAEIFEQLSYERKSYAREVKKHIKEMNLHVYEPGDFLSLLHSTWKNMRVRLQTGDHEMIKSCCVLGENVASNYYESLLAGLQMPSALNALLNSQLQGIYEAAQRFASMRSSGHLRAPNALEVSENGRKRISFLIAYLQQVSKDFEMIADEIEDPNLKNAFLAFAIEDRQFADELTCQAEHAGISAADTELRLYWDYLEEDTSAEMLPNHDKRNELVAICDKSEYLFLKLYTDALKEFLNLQNFKDMMVYQYNSIRSAFVKLRLLNSLRYHDQVAQG